MKKYFKQLKANKKGFTLIEMIVVIAIIGILAAILVPSMAGYLSTARDSKKEANAKTVYTAAQAAVTSYEGIERLVNQIYTDATAKTRQEQASPSGHDNKLFNKMLILLGKSNYNKFTEIKVKVTDGAVEWVSVKEDGEAVSITYPKGVNPA